MGLFAAAGLRYGGLAPSRRGRRPFSLGYGAIVPSSLTTVPPIASVCSTRPPESVLVRAPRALPRGFSREHGLGGFAMRLRLASRPCRAPRICLGGRPTCFHGDVQNPARLPPSVAPSVERSRGGTGMSACRAFAYALRPRLSTRLTLGGQASPRKPWAYGGRVSHPALATHASILTPPRSTEGRPFRFAPRGKLPYH